MNDIEVREMYDEVLEMKKQLNALKEASCNCSCCKEKE